jgi:hypothetical protein
VEGACWGSFMQAFEGESVRKEPLSNVPGGGWGFGSGACVSCGCCCWWGEGG